MNKLSILLTTVTIIIFFQILGPLYAAYEVTLTNVLPDITVYYSIPGWGFKKPAADVHKKFLINVNDADHFMLYANGWQLNVYHPKVQEGISKLNWKVWTTSPPLTTYHADYIFPKSKTEKDSCQLFAVFEFYHYSCPLISDDMIITFLYNTQRNNL